LECKNSDRLFLFCPAFLDFFGLLADKKKPCPPSCPPLWKKSQKIQKDKNKGFASFLSAQKNRIRTFKVEIAKNHSLRIEKPDANLLRQTGMVVRRFLI
jgi:hypothetical protein